MENPAVPSVVGTPSGFDIIAAVLGVEADIIKLGVGYARVAYRKLVVALFVMIGIILCGFILNVAASYTYPTIAKILYGINIIAATGFVVITAILWWRPNQVAWVGVAGAIIEKLGDRDGGISYGAKWLIGEYANIFKMVTLVGTIALFYLGIIPFGKNPIAFFIIVSGGIVTGLLADRYKEQFQGTFAIEILFYGVCVVIALSVLSLVPVESWGEKESFGQRLVCNIKSGVFLFALLLTLVVTLSMKGFRKWALVLLGVTGIMFVPVNISLPKLPWSANETHASISENVRSTKQVVPQKEVHRLTATNLKFASQDIGDNETGEYYCPDGTLMDFEYTGRPNDDNLIDCDVPATGVRLGDGKTGRRIRFISKSEVDTYPTVTIVN